MSGAWRPTAASTFTARRSAGWAASITDAPTPSGWRGRVRVVAGVGDAGAIFAAAVARALIGAAACTRVARSATKAAGTTAAATSAATRGGAQRHGGGAPARCRDERRDDRQTPARRPAVEPPPHRREPGPVAD